ncbi:hypothetical protein APW44_02960 [Staphylococcus aureus]|nr:hypothetical protein APW44_02960 [Staphylococcus aureus]
MKTYSEARARLRWYQGRYIDFDGWYGYQCADLAVDYIYWLLEIRMWGNAKDAINNDFKNMATVYEITPVNTKNPNIAFKPSVNCSV